MPVLTHHTFGLDRDNPRMSGKADRRSTASLSITFEPQPSAS